MNLREKKSKVAICKGCKGFVLACHTDYLSKSIEKEFTQFTNDGFEIKIETLEKTKSRNIVFYSNKKNGKCKTCNNEK